MTGDEARRQALRPRARLMQHLGQDLIPNDRVALYELIKNSYDADASLVVLRFRDTASTVDQAAARAGGDQDVTFESEDPSPALTLELWDDGHGMDEDRVVSNWLEIANPNRVKNPRSESGLRRVQGAKGLGRFAVARLAPVTELVTRRAGAQEVALRVDWDAFTDEDAFLDELEIGWSVRNTPVVFGPDGEASEYMTSVLRRLDEDAEPVAVEHGTLLRLTPAREQWDGAALDELTIGLSRLTPPEPPKDLGVPIAPEFRILIDRGADRAPVAVEPSATIANPTYRLVGTVDAHGQATLTFSSGTAAPETIILEIPAVARCGPIALDLRAWDLDGSGLAELRAKDRTTRTLKEVRDLIRSASGVAIYRDGFRVQPYGDSEFDWLGLDARRVNNPTMRLSNNQIVGFVFTTADDNPGLRDQANRQGLIDNDARAALEEAVTTAIRTIEERRYALRRAPQTPAQERERHGGIFAAFSLEGVRQVAAAVYPNDRNLHEAIDRAEADIERGVENVQDVISRFSRLATMGSLVDVVLHDGNTALTSMNHVVDDLRRRAAEVARPTSSSDCEALCVELRERLTALADRMQIQIDALGKLFDSIAPLSGRRRGRPRKVALHDILNRSLSAIQGELDRMGVRAEVVGEDRVVTVDAADVMQIVINLVRNAMYWISTNNPPGQRRVVLRTSRGADDSVLIDVLDNGPGVPEAIAQQIFDAYFTTREKGTGLGLNIAGSIAAEFYDGGLSLVNDTSMPGACFRVTLRRRLG